MIADNLTTKSKAPYGILKAYATILFCHHPLIGMAYIMATFLLPNTGISGVVAAISGYLTARLLRFPHIENGMYVYNSLLVGLTLGATYHFDHYLAVLIIFGSIMAVFVTAVATDLLWRWEHLPVLSLPFVVVALIVAFAVDGYGSLTHFMKPYLPAVTVLHPAIDGFFTSLGATLFLPLFWAGVIFFCGIIITSRYLALLAVCGYCVGTILFFFFKSGSNTSGFGNSGFNFILTAMAIGGMFTVPEWKSFILAMISSAITALITAATHNFLKDYGIPVFAIPFLVATFSVLAAMRKRAVFAAPYLLLEDPNIPEVNYEKSRIARARSGNINSLPLAVPFFGSWSVYQGFDGEHTHKSPWQYALDFIVLENGKSHQYDGKKTEDYFCFGLPVTSPAYGQVVRINDGIADNTPGEVDTKNNWGNFILIKTSGNLYILLCHLKNGSIKLNEGDYVKPGMIIAYCGNSGRSPQPHLHIHVQTEATLGSATAPFHLLSVIVESAENRSAYFKLNHIPQRGEIIKSAEKTAKLARPIHLPVGRRICYNCKTSESREDILELITVITLTGQFRIETSSGASCAFEENDGVLAFYDRAGAKDIFFDIWLLSHGVTPLSEEACCWHDRPAGSLVPLNKLKKIALYMTTLFQPGLKSQYKRSWKDTGGFWVQESTHQLVKPPFINISLKTSSMICPERGFNKISAELDGVLYELNMLLTEQKGDTGVEEWIILNSNNKSEVSPE